MVISIIVILVLVTFSINLLVNNGIMDKAKSAVGVYSESEIGELPIPEREQCTFEGWYTAEEGGKHVT